MRSYDDIPTGRGTCVRVSRTTYRGRERVDIRTMFEARPGDPGTRTPTKKGVSLLLEDLPRLLVALHALERDAIAAGELLPEDYENAGAPLPDALWGPSAGSARGRPQTPPPR